MRCLQGKKGFGEKGRHTGGRGRSERKVEMLPGAPTQQTDIICGRKGVWVRRRGRGNGARTFEFGSKRRKNTKRLGVFQSVPVLKIRN